MCLLQPQIQLSPNNLKSAALHAPPTTTYTNVHTSRNPTPKDESAKPANSGKRRLSDICQVTKYTTYTVADLIDTNLKSYQLCDIGSRIS
ncbi:hypothetical protein CC80DRAFT_324836 [Byssothecium circinans]|uniref:Uncharacterized protein n=1 Tax=Byssothecium circinans TaxID=147558 RepID=A0A6A5UDW0_9PLEO|nr:hypothetical protein CC80DRAFT_324836 [Byssothecium circinans]